MRSTQHWKKLVIGIALTLALIASAGPVAIAEERTCQETLDAITVDNLRVPEDATCTLAGTRVQGTIKVERNATLYASNVNVVGNIQAENAARVEIVARSVVGGSIQIVQGGAALIDTVRMKGDLFFDANQGSLIATENRIGGNLQAFQNTGGVTIADNFIDGNLQCKENQPAPIGGGNLVQGNAEDQCAQLAVEVKPYVFLSLVELHAHAPDTAPPRTTIDSGPAATTTSTSATFTFSASESGVTFACALDGAAFTPCASPHTVTGLATGVHVFSVRATDLSGNTDPTPARYIWTIAPAPDCGASITVFADADSWIDQNSAFNNFGTDAILKVRSQGPSDNFRTLVRFALPNSVPAGCAIESATLRLYAAAATTGRTIEALRIAAGWTEHQVTWSNQPATIDPPVATSSESGYREWNVAAQVQAMYAAGANHGFLIRDAAESGGGPEQQFHGKEKGEHPPMLIVTFVPAVSLDTTITGGR